MDDEMSVTYEIKSMLREEQDCFILEHILPYCNEHTEYRLEKEDLKHALWLLSMERNGNVRLFGKAKWVEKNAMYICTACEHRLSKLVAYDVGGIYNYCPFCGAEMEVDA